MSDRGFTPVAGLNPPLPVRRTDLMSSVAGSATKLFNGFFEWFGEPGHLFLASSPGCGYAAV